MANTHDIAKDLVALCKDGKFDEAGEKYWAEDVLSVEAAGDAAVSRGKAAARAKGEAWANANEVHGFEVGVYTLKNGKIAEERFFHAQ